MKTIETNYLQAGGRRSNKTETDSDTAEDVRLNQATKVTWSGLDTEEFGDKSEEEQENKKLKTTKKNHPCIECKGTYKKHWGLR